MQVTPKMGCLIMVFVLGTLFLGSQSQNKPLPEPPPLMVLDLENTINELGKEHASLRVQREALLRQVREWKERAKNCPGAK